jgi:hypothetical protein
MSGALEQRYRRVLRLLPGYYRQQWEEDMVAAFLDSWLTGDPEFDEYLSKVARPGWAETASVVGLASRLYLGAAGTPGRYFAWGQALRRAVLALVLIQATRGLDILVRTGWSRHVLAWLPAPPASMTDVTPPGIVPPAVWYLVAYAWIVSFLALVLGHYRTAQLIAALAIIPDLAWLVQSWSAGALPAFPLGAAAFWVLLNLVPVLAMTAFHRDAPPMARGPWLLALPASYFLVAVPLLAVQATGHTAWLPDFPGLYCLLIALACVAYAPRAWSQGGPRIWTLALILLAADAAAYRIFSINAYRHDPHMIEVSLAELFILMAAAALIAPAAIRADRHARTAAVSAARMNP